MSNSYKILFDKRLFFKELSKVPKKFHKTIDEKINSLSKNPRPEGAKKLKGDRKERIREER